MKRFRFLVLCLPVFMAGGCKVAQSDYMPMKVGRSWSYVTQILGSQRTVDLTVESKVPIGGVDGYEIACPYGRSRLAWKNGRLVASELAGTWFDPPVIVLDPEHPKLTDHQDTKVSDAVGSYDLTILFSQDKTKAPVGGIVQPGLKSTLEIEWGFVQKRPPLRVESYWVRGVGLVKQEEWVGTNQVIGIAWLSGPTKLGSASSEKE